MHCNSRAFIWMSLKTLGVFVAKGSLQHMLYTIYRRTCSGSKRGLAQALSMKHLLLKGRLLRALRAVKTKFTDIRPWSSPNHCIFPQKEQQRHPHVRSVVLSALTLLQYARNRPVCRDGRHLTRLLNAAAARRCGWHLESAPSAQQRPA